MTDKVKNPFGIRDNKTILIHDLGESERGLKCNCVCPNCGCRYVARFGTIIKPHFAHEKNAVCDEVLAVLTGLYNFISESISNGGIFRVPGYCGAVPEFIPAISYSWDEYWNSASFVRCNFGDLPRPGYMYIIEPTEIVVSSVELCYDSKKYPSAALLHFDFKGKEGTLALILLPPATICKDVKPKKFQDYSTIALEVESLEDMDSNKLREIICYRTEEKSWISSRKICSWMKDQFNQYQENLSKWKKQNVQSQRKFPPIDISTIRQQTVRWNGNVYYPGSSIQHPKYGMGSIISIEERNNIIGLCHFITADFNGQIKTFFLEIDIK